MKKVASHNPHFHDSNSGKVYGIDVSSGAVVKALGVEAGDHVLDLCCAPGLPFQLTNQSFRCKIVYDCR